MDPVVSDTRLKSPCSRAEEDMTISRIARSLLIAAVAFSAVPVLAAEGAAKPTVKAAAHHKKHKAHAPKPASQAK